MTNFFPITDPTLQFLVMLAIILLAPIATSRLRIPHIVGMIMAGILVGPHGIGLLTRDGSFALLGQVGLYYIMLLAGLEMNMSNARKSIKPTAVNGVLSFSIPMVLGTLVNLYVLHFSWLSSVLLASLYASRTLIAYPTVQRFGIAEQRAVTIAVGATAFTDTLTLLVLAVVAGTFQGEVDTLFWLLLIVKVAAVFAVIIYCFPRWTRFFFRRFEDGILQFVFVMALTFLGAWLMQLVGMEGLLGAFIVGLTINRYVPKLSSLMTQLEFVGNALFIPYFLIGVGMLVNIRLLFAGIGTLEVATVMVAMALVSKWLSSWGTQRLFGMRAVEGQLMFGLSCAQAGATLAAVMVGYDLRLPDGSRLLGDEVLNGTILLILVTCILSSVATERAAKKLVLETTDVVLDDHHDDDEQILIPVAHRKTATELVKLAVYMRHQKLGRALIAINVVIDSPQRAAHQKRGRDIIAAMERTATERNVRLTGHSRISTNVSGGIKHAFMEYDASEIIMGMHVHQKANHHTWGDLHQNLFSSLNRQIIMVQLVQPLKTLRRIQVAVPSRAQFEPGFARWLERLSRMASHLDCRIVFHGRMDTLQLINEYVRNRHPNVRAEYARMDHWNAMPTLARTIKDDHLFVIVTARKGTISYKSALERLPDEVSRSLGSGKNLMVIYPDQYGNVIEPMSFAHPMATDEPSAYEGMGNWLARHLRLPKVLANRKR